MDRGVPAKKVKPLSSRIRDRQGRVWTMVVKTVEQDDDLEPWCDLSPQVGGRLSGSPARHV
jgi:hypothetical protein